MPLSLLQEHLLPLHVVFGASKGDASACTAKSVYNQTLLGTWVSGFQFGEAEKQ